MTSNGQFWSARHTYMQTNIQILRAEDPQKYYIKKYIKKVGKKFGNVKIISVYLWKLKTMENELINKIMSINKETFTKDDIIFIINAHYNKKENLTTDYFTIEVDNYSVIKDNKTIRLPRKEFLVLEYLVRKRNSVVRRKELLDRIWGTDIIVIDRTIDVHIRKIKKRIGEEIPIKTIKGIGYMWSD